MNRFSKLYHQLIKNPLEIIPKIISKYPINRIIPDRIYVYLSYLGYTGYHLNLNNPLRFTEKLQWLKLNERDESFTQLSDKYGVREFVADRVGKQYLITLYKCYDSTDEIDLNELPNQFVLKCTHDSGSVIICNNKAEMDIAWMKKKLNKHLKRNYFYEHREYSYKKIPPKIVCEELISTDGSKVPTDYKFFCFNGIPQFIQVDIDRFEDHTRIIYDTNWNRAKFSIKFPYSYLTIERPTKLDEMLMVASKLSQGFKFVRIDLYQVNEQVLFGEMTFIHGAGYEPFFPDEYDFKIGELINLTD